MFDTVHDKLHFTKGALELIDTLHEHGWKIGVVSGGFHEVVDMLAAEGISTIGSPTGLRLPMGA